VQGDAAYSERCRQESIRLARYYMQIAARRGIFGADASSWELGFAFDGVHLSEEGHEVFAREMAKVLQKTEKEL
jgi:lysophospholipase L1-like esterase